MDAHLLQGIRYFTRERHIMSGLAVLCGDSRRCRSAWDGVRDPDGSLWTPDTLCDLASLTKLFTGVCALRLREEGALDPGRPVTDYEPRFIHLGGVTVDQVMSFQPALKTPGRVDDQPSAAAGLEKLFAITPAPAQPPRYYSDMHAMVLGKVLEAAGGAGLFSLISRLILQPLDMRSTFAAVPADDLGRCAVYDLEHRVENGRCTLRAGIRPGMPHDPKARLLSPDGRALCGHAGLFSTLDDLRRFCQGLLAGKVLSPESLALMAENRTGRPLPSGGFSQYLGRMCYVRHPDQYYSEVPVSMSRSAIAMGGFTGNHLSLDPVTGRWTVFLGNRVLNRLTVMTLPPGGRREDWGLNPDGTGCVLWPDGTRVWSSVDYVHKKDAYLHAAVMEALAWTPVTPGWA